MTTAQALGNVGLAHPANETATTTITVATNDALAVGNTLRALARTAPASAAEMMDRVGRQLVSAGMLAMKVVSK